MSGLSTCKNKCPVMSDVMSTRAAFIRIAQTRTGNADRYADIDARLLASQWLQEVMQVGGAAVRSMRVWRRIPARAGSSPTPTAASPMAMRMTLNSLREHACPP